MTDDELIERVARAICFEAGKDPDARVQINDTENVQQVGAVVVQTATEPRWHYFREEARKHIAAWKVLRAVLPTPYPDDVMPELPLTQD